MTIKQEKQSLTESDTINGAAANIAATDTKIINNIFHQKSLPSLGELIFPVVPLAGPTGGVFAIEEDGNRFKLLRNEVQVYDIEPVDTDITLEAVQDLYNIYGISYETTLSNLLNSIKNTEENKKVLAFLDDNSKDFKDFTQNDFNNVWVWEFSQAFFNYVYQIKTLINSNNFRSKSAYVVVPQNIYGAIEQRLVNLEQNDTKDKENVLMRGNLEVYMNPDKDSTVCYVGCVDKENISKSAAWYLPYVKSIHTVTESVRGDKKLFMHNRFALGISPLHKEGNEMMYKFNVSLS